MRLNPKEVKKLIEALNSYLNTKTAQLYLYGSRVREDLKGGDIDLLLLVENENDVAQLLAKKHYLLASMKKNIGDQKIDLIIAAKNELDQDEFLKMIWPTVVLLNQW